MPRLRTTSGLSLLALAVGVAGTVWISSLTAGWRGPAARVAIVHHAASIRHALPSRRHVPVRGAQMHRVDTQRLVGEAQAMPLTEPPELVPLAMPGDTSQSWDELRGHLDGRVLVHVEIDGGGRVKVASVAESSGDPVLDTHALRSVHGWRFAVPADHPDGIGGDLSMRFSAQGERIAQLP
ncbi:energy transducer TonB [Rhodanobacter sp. C03]|uniref:energy transducer TonB n=1 Tax=Rhodanobacter sp. C03 TaxID=1945858 RepID=UPI0009841191|nr:energy transducer TonB [Rhodanobacter sp. C03]OOG57941.1 energy transducer TonB [Rhodanobacter sp. C03]